MEKVLFNKSDYTILSALVSRDCYTEIRSLSIKQISDETKLSIPKIRLVLKTFLIIGYIKEGAKDGISKTYYITEKGKEFLDIAMYGEERGE
jgi:DNA-binding transcriptional regulator GbsR (MarR family)